MGEQAGVGEMHAGGKGAGTAVLIVCFSDSTLSYGHLGRFGCKCCLLAHGRHVEDGVDNYSCVCFYQDLNMPTSTVHIHAGFLCQWWHVALPV